MQTTSNSKLPLGPGRWPNRARRRLDARENKPLGKASKKSRVKLGNTVAQLKRQQPHLSEVQREGVAMRLCGLDA